MNTTEQDHYWLRETIKLAEQCPPSSTAFSVGAIIVDADGNEISRGNSRDTHPTIHAEESALARAGDDPRLETATIYSSLEPCGERKSRPQTCAQLIIGSGIRRVLYARSEPATYVGTPCGRKTLQAAGVEVLELGSTSHSPNTHT